MATLFGRPRSEVIKHPGAFKRKAKKAHSSVAEFARKVLGKRSHASRQTKRQAALAKAFETMRRKKRLKQAGAKGG